MRMAAPDTKGTPAARQASLMAKRVAMLSVASSTTSAAAAAAWSDAPASRVVMVSTATVELMPATQRAAESTFHSPSVASLCAIWRCRLERFTTSSSASVRWPTPAAAR